MKIKMQIAFGIAAVFVLALGANLNYNANAKEQDPATNNQSKGLTVSPSVDKLGYLEPGETYTREITVVNPGDKNIAFKVLTSSFWVEDESYEVKWGVSESQYSKIAHWTDIDQTKVHEVKAGETYPFTYRIAVPEDQSGGAQRLMVTISLGQTGGEGFVTAETHLNTLIYANIEGDVHPNAEIVSRSIQVFSLEPIISTQSTLKNTGDVDLDVTYKLSAADFFSGEQKFSLEEEKTLMTESTRMFEQTWTQAPFLGVFHVTQEVTVLGEVHTFTSVAVICPLWLIVIVVLAVAGITLYLIYRHNDRKKRKRS